MVKRCVVRKVGEEESGEEGGMVRRCGEEGR